MRNLHWAQRWHQIPIRRARIADSTSRPLIESTPPFAERDQRSNYRTWSNKVSRQSPFIVSLPYSRGMCTTARGGTISRGRRFPAHCPSRSIRHRAWASDNLKRWNKISSRLTPSVIYRNPTHQSRTAILFCPTHAVCSRTRPIRVGPPELISWYRNQVNTPVHLILHVIIVLHKTTLTLP